MLLRRFRIRTVLTLAFAVTIVLMSVIVVTALAQMGEINRHLTTIVDEQLVKSELASSIRDEVRVRTELIRDLAIIADPAERERRQQLFDQSIHHYAEQLTRLAQLARSPRERALVERIKEAGADAYPVVSEAVRFAVDGFAEEAQEQIAVRARPLQLALLDLLRQMVEIQQEEVHANTVGAIEDYRDGRTTLLLLGLAVLLCGGLLALAIVRGINGALEPLVATVTAVARDGDLSRRAEVRGDNEIDHAVAAFNRLLTTLQEAVGKVNRVMGAVAEGDFTARVEGELPGELGQLQRSVNDSAHSVATTMRMLDGVMAALSRGDLRARVGGDVRGEFRDRVNGAMATLQAAIEDINGVMEAVAAQDLSRRVTVAAEGDLAALKNNINASLGQLGQTLAGIAANARQVAAAAGQSGAAIGQVRHGAQRQVEAINQVAAAMTETSAAVTEVAAHAAEAAGRAVETTQMTQAGREGMRQLSEAVEAIVRGGAQVTKITDLIRRIANRTNLLALNAAIEAARAGEHGRGFAVVAEEVRKLAEHAGESARDIAELLERGAADGERAAAAAAVDRDMERIAALAEESGDMLTLIAEAIEQQQATVHEVAESMETLRTIGHGTASATEEIDSTARELTHIAEQTREQVERFRRA